MFCEVQLYLVVVSMVVLSQLMAILGKLIDMDFQKKLSPKSKKNFQTNSLKNVGGVGFLVNDTWAKWGFEI